MSTTALAGSIPASISATPALSLLGPYLGAHSYYWSQYLTPKVVGTVMVTVNEATNQTISSTIYHSEYAVNGSSQLLTRTDVNSAGTVTAVLYDDVSSVSSTMQVSL